MVSCDDRRKYMSEYNEESSSDEDYNEIPHKKRSAIRDISNNRFEISKEKHSFQKPPRINYEPYQKFRASTRQPKCYSKNAIMARENRLRKKMYMTNLEDKITSLVSENEKLSSLVENQSCLISDLKKEVKYLKSVLSNSSDISKLIRNIHQNTGMSVSTSLERSFDLKNNYVSKPKLPVARKTAHPWEEKELDNLGEKSIFEIDSSFSICDDTSLSLLGVAPDFDFNMLDDDLFKAPIVEEKLNSMLPLEEHNYTSSKDSEEDVGVCLHVSKHKVSLEFCNSCSENAAMAWVD